MKEIGGQKRHKLVKCSLWKAPRYLGIVNLHLILLNSLRLGIRYLGQKCPKNIWRHVFELISTKVSILLTNCSQSVNNSKMNDFFEEWPKKMETAF